MAIGTRESLPRGNSWDRTHPNFFPPPDYYERLQLTEKPEGLLEEFTDGIRELYLQPGWKLRAVLGDEGYLVAVYVHPSRTEVIRRIPPYDKLVKPEAVAHWVNQENPSNGWALKEEQLNAVLAGSNRLLYGRASAQYNELFARRYYDPENGEEITYNVVGGNKYYQAGVGLVIAHFRTLGALITDSSRRRESLVAETRRAFGKSNASLQGELAAYGNELRKSVKPKLAEIDHDLVRFRGLMVDNPRSLFGQ